MTETELRAVERTIFPMPPIPVPKGQEPHGCRFIAADPQDPGWSYCQKPQAAGSSYCAEHHAKCTRTIEQAAADKAKAARARAAQKRAA